MNLCSNPICEYCYPHEQACKSYSMHSLEIIGERKRVGSRPSGQEYRVHLVDVDRTYNQ